MTNISETGETLKKRAKVAAREVQHEMASSDLNKGTALILAGSALVFLALLLVVQALIVALAKLGIGAGWASAVVGLLLAWGGVTLIARGEKS